MAALTWDNYYAWIMAANNVIKQIDASDFATLDATQKSYLGFAYAYRAMFYLDLVRLYEFKENNYTEAPGVLGLGVPIVLPETTEAEAKNNPRCQGRRHLRSSDLPRPGQGRRTVERLYGSRQVYDQSGAGLRTESPGLA